MITAESVTSYQFWRERVASIESGPSRPDLILTGTYIEGEGELSEEMGWEPLESFLSRLSYFERVEPEYGVPTLGIGQLGYGIRRGRRRGYDLVGSEVYDVEVEFLEAENQSSFLFIDFDIPVTEENTKRIVKNFKKIGIGRGTLFVSNASYYFISKDVFFLDALPVIYGKVILAFTKDNPSLGWAREIGRDLIRAEGQEEVKEVCHFILENVGHFPKDGKGWSSCTTDLDLRYIAHSLLRFPFIRISRKEGYLGPPISIVEIEEGDEDEIRRFRDYLESEVFPPTTKST